ncbi:hypothetical protein AVEN_269374-1 [Araneus ventricosus]|uniref:Uncharacterized protein n=1 Tax=Araneus ventricosus TaxID=182803 RepID=A0A4Y2MIS7_ARAVE|nr:hypothetical protein AVEN_175382-1 [Araneus ventricosus]GBN27087.1 hypothetical protein AVEN_269374-1 [Araneus ventricosus]
MRRPLSRGLESSAAAAAALLCEVVTILASLSKMSAVASWSDLQRDMAMAAAVLATFMETAMSSLVIWWREGVGDMLSEPQEELSLSSAVGRRLILGEWFGRRPRIWAWMCSQIRLNRRMGPVDRNALGENEN